MENICKEFAIYENRTIEDSGGDDVDVLEQISVFKTEEEAFIEMATLSEWNHYAIIPIYSIM